MALIIAALLISLVLCQIDYTQTNWAPLCSSGRDQSPINFPNWKVGNYGVGLMITDIKYELLNNIKLTTDSNFF